MRSLALLAAAVFWAAPAASARKPIRIVASESFWGSIAAQLAGDRGTVTSIVANPAVDPHDYEPNASDARALASSQVAILNGIGYDGWASRLLAADPSDGRVVVDAGRVLGLKTGDNPHQWYSPAAVRRMVAAILAGLQRADPRDARVFAENARRFQARSLARYDALRREIRRRFAGVPVGYSESMFEPLGADLGLQLVTPPSFANAVAEGGDLTAGDVQTVERQARDRQIAVWIYDSQNLTPEVQRVNAIAADERIPTVSMTETLEPAGATFESWQAAQLERLLAALHLATGR